MWLIHSAYIKSYTEQNSRKKKCAPEEWNYMFLKLLNKNICVSVINGTFCEFLFFPHIMLMVGCMWHYNLLLSKLFFINR